MAFWWVNHKVQIMKNLWVTFYNYILQFRTL